MEMQGNLRGKREQNIQVERVSDGVVYYSHGTFQKLQSFRMRENNSVCKTTLHLLSQSAYFSNWVSRCRRGGTRIPKLNQPCGLWSMNKVTKSGHYFPEGAWLRAKWMAGEGQSTNLLPLLSKREQASSLEHSQHQGKQAGTFSCSCCTAHNKFLVFKDKIFSCTWPFLNYLELMLC